MTMDAPGHIAAGKLFNDIEKLPPDQRAAILGLTQDERKRVMAMSDKERVTHMAGLKKKLGEKIDAGKAAPKIVPATEKEKA